MVEPTPIDIPFPDDSVLRLEIHVGACRLNLVPGDDAAWVSGRYTDPSGRLPCTIRQEGGALKISQEPNWRNMFGWRDEIPRFDLRLGSARPYDLEVASGASENALDLGGLPLRSLSIKQGAGTLTLDFSAPNPEPLALLSLGAGAAEFRLRNLAHANAAEVNIDGGAASFKIDAGGELRRDLRLRISAGMSSVELAVPRTTPVSISSESVLGSVEVDPAFRQQDGSYTTETGQPGEAPRLTVRVSVALGALKLRAT